MLNVYAAKWCPHCQATVAFLKKKSVPFNYIEIEEQPDDVVRKVVEVNGGDDWVVPTLELDGRWRPGKRFDEAGLVSDLRSMGLEI